MATRINLANVDSKGIVSDTSIIATLTTTSNPEKLSTSLVISIPVDKCPPLIKETFSAAKPSATVSPMITSQGNFVAEVTVTSTITSFQEGTSPSTASSSNTFIVIAVVIFIVVVAGITVCIIIIILVSRNKRSKKSITSKIEPTYHFISNAGNVKASVHEVTDHTSNRKEENDQYVYAAIDELHNSTRQNVLINPVYDINENNTIIALHEAIETTKGETHMYSLLESSTKNRNILKENNFVSTPAIQNNISEMYAVVDMKKFKKGANIDDEYAVVDKTAKKYKASNGMFP